MRSRMFRQLTPYETSIYFVPDMNIVYQREAQVAAINAQRTERSEMLSKGYPLIVLGTLSIALPLLGAVQSAFFALAILSMIATLAVLVRSISEKSKLGCVSLGGISIMAASAFYVFHPTIAGAIILFSLALFLYPIYIGIKLVSAAHNMNLIEYKEIVQIPPPTDEEFDAWLEDRASMLFSDMIRELNLDDKISHSRQLLRVRGYVLQGTREARYFRSQDLLSKRGADGRWRYSVNTYTYFYPDKHQIMVFTFYINAMNWDDYRKKTEEYFYQDIIGVTSIDDHDTLYVDGRAYNYRTQRFSLKLSDGSAVSATVHSRPLDDYYLPTFDMPNSGIDTTVAQLRMLLREKKA